MSTWTFCRPPPRSARRASTAADPIQPSTRRRLIKRPAANGRPGAAAQAGQWERHYFALDRSSGTLTYRPRKLSAAKTRAIRAPRAVGVLPAIPGRPWLTPFALVTDSGTFALAAESAADARAWFALLEAAGCEPIEDLAQVDVDERIWQPWLASVGLARTPSRSAFKWLV